MKKRSNNKKALALSLLSLLLCCSMLVGTTFAWFTDSVSSGANRIVAGNLDVDVFYGDPSEGNSITGMETLFNDVTLWEPGAVAYENLTIANLGTLALKYTMGVSFTNENYVLVDGEPTYSLPQILKVGLVPGGIQEGLSRDEVIEAVGGQWYAMETYTWEGELLANTNEETMGVAIWWEPSDEDNNWNLNNGKLTDDGTDYLYVDLGINLFATQLVQEEDSFGNDYDASIELPMVAGGTLELGPVKVVVPENAPAGNYTLNVEKFDLKLDTDHKAVLDTDISVLKDGEPTDPSEVTYEISLQLDIMAKDFALTHKGQPVTEFDYDPFTGILTFTTDSFSPFGVSYNIFGKDVQLDGRKIVRGFFSKGEDPATYDPSLVGNAEYITVKFQKDGKDIWSVSKAADTCFVGREAGTYEDVNGFSHPITVNDTGKLYSIISGLQSKDHSTVYLLPGTYTEKSTIYITSSMDIVGLGDTDSVKLIKGSSSNSNRHLLNASGTKADYIQVTIRNLYLDASAKTTGGKDNAAVQSIRKSKVKCYDLNIVKGTGWDAVALYVNGSNAVDGVKYPAYLYAEDCSLNTTQSFGVVSTSTQYKFFHGGLTYGGKTYTNNSGSIKNIVLPSNNWDWTVN